jgi:hypothetical protein
MFLIPASVAALWALKLFQTLHRLVHLLEVLIAFSLAKKIDYATRKSALYFDFCVNRVDVSAPTIFVYKNFAAVNAFLGGEFEHSSLSVHFEDVLFLFDIRLKVVRTVLVKVAFNRLFVLLFYVLV